MDGFEERDGLSVMDEINFSNRQQGGSRLKFEKFKLHDHFRYT